MTLTQQTFMNQIMAMTKIRKTYLRGQNKTAGNSGYKRLAVHCLNEHLCLVSSFVVVDSFSLRNRQLLVAANRHV